ncbi:facilitated trehalose transporter Tret1-like [Cydia fagiglandana]|uniref:facilitated trehalose transporter Tret1-like n=1 Tax=Cydia fagiglandana TaxID=1458189 RepID=UPI002FEDF925
MTARDKSKLCGYVPRLNVDHEMFKELQKHNITLSDVGDATAPDIGLLIGADHAGVLLTESFVELNNNLVAIKNKFGWTLQGPIMNTCSVLMNVVLENETKLTVYDREVNIETEKVVLANNTADYFTFLCSLLSGYAANRVGRKPILLLTSSFNILGYAIMANAVNVSTMKVGRFTAGIAAGSIHVINVVYLGEMASPEMRGAIIAMAGIMHVFGNLLVCSLGPYVSVGVTCYVCVCISCVHVLVLCYVPESHVYQVMKGKLNDARLTLHDLGRDEDVEEELKLICKHNNEALLPQTKDGHRKAKRCLIRHERKNIRAFYITTVLLCLQATRGRIAAIYLATIILKIKFSSLYHNFGNVVLGLTELCGVIMTPLLVERCGRRVMLKMSLGFCCLFMTILGTYLYLEVNHYVMTDTIKWLPLASLLLFLFAYNFGVGIVPNILSGEMYSPPFSSTFCSISMSLAWLVRLHSWNFNLLVTDIFTPGNFYACAAVNAMGLVFVIFVVPETAGKSLKEIGNSLERHCVF